MSRRIDIELTSQREDGAFTWRQAGAKAPKGVVEPSVLPVGAKVGDQYKVEVEVFLDGLAITQVIPGRSPRNEPERIELRAPTVRDEQLVTTQLAGRRDRGDRRDRGERGERGERGDRRSSGRPGGDRPRGDRPDNRGPRPPRGDGGPRREPRPERPKPRRLRPGRVHRRALIESLPEEQRPIAEELSKGGVPAVRAALEAQNQAARAEGRPEVSPEPLVVLAEELWPRMRSAEWRDRAEAALADLAELDLRDLRSVVVAADSGARDDETRALAARLREGLNGRVESEHTEWLTSLAELVVEGRVVAALRQSSRPPKAGAPLPPDLAQLLIQKASESLTSETLADRWAVVLDALSFSPVRGSVKPVSMPEAPSDALKATVQRYSARVPHIAAMFGVEVVAAPADGRSRGPRRGGSGQGGGGRPAPSAPAAAPRPPTAPAPEAPAAEAPAAEAPAAESQAPEAPTAESQPAEAPAADSPAPDAPTAESQAAEAPAADSPAPDAPAAEVSAAESPAPGEPAEVVAPEAAAAEVHAPMGPLTEAAGVEATDGTSVAEA
jgi:hypothetical protein